MVILLFAHEMDWTLLSVISNSVFAGALVFVTLYYNYKMERRAQKDRLRQEMDLLIAPLYAMSKGSLKSIFFLKGSPGYIDDSSFRVQQYFRFWDNIQKYKYLGSDSLRSAIEHYLDRKSNDVHDRNRDPEYEAAENQLLMDVEQRYNELSVLVR